MNNKKITLIRLIIFVVLANAPMIAMCIVLNKSYGWPFWTEAPEAIVAMIGLIGMFLPTVANILTRLFTHEGADNLYLGFKIRNNGRYYFAAIAVKLAEAVGGMILIYLLFLKGLSFSEAFDLNDMNLKMASLTGGIVYTTIVCFHAFGEEFGWRGYMMPKLIELVGKPMAVLIGGVIWGLWHAPLTVSGHNFGTDYAGFPYVGILIMCLMCTLENSFLTLLTERSKTVYPAAIVHSINNAINGLVLISFFGSEASFAILEKISPVEGVWGMMIMIALTGIISFVLLLQKSENGEL